MPGAVVGAGVVGGSALALNAVGLVLVYRASGVLNLAQVQIGVAAAVLFRLLVEQDVVAYWPALALSFAASICIAWAIHATVVRRLARAPRLVLTIATIGIANLLGALQEMLPGWFATEAQRELNQVPRGGPAPPPIDGSLEWSPVIFRASDVLTVVLAAVALAGVALFLRHAAGVSMRAAADDAARASTLGIDPDAQAARAWMLAGALSGVAGLTAAMSTASPESGALSAALLVRILGVAVIASMTSVRIAVLGGVVLGAFDRALLWVLDTSAPVDATIAGVIVAILVLRRARTTRADLASVGAWRAAREARPIPPELARDPGVRAWVRAGAWAGALALLAVPFVLSPAQTAAASAAIVTAIVLLSLLVVTGWAGQVSLGAFALAAVGAAVTAAIGDGAPFLVALAAAGAAGALMGVVVGLPALRARGLTPAITTLAIAVWAAALLQEDLLGGRLRDVARPSFLGLDLADGRTFFYVVAVLGALAVAAVVGLRRSRVGRVLLAARDNEAAAAAFGIDVVRARVTAFAIAGALAGVAGSVFAVQQGGVEGTNFTAETSIVMFVLAVIGGLGSVAGPIVGAAILGALHVLGVSPAVLFLATGGGVVAIVTLAPDGLAGLAYATRDAMLRRHARRRRIPVPSLGVDPHETGRAPIAPAQDEPAVTYALPGTWR